MTVLHLSLCVCVCGVCPPLVHMVQQVLLEHPAPPLDNIHQHVLKRSDVKLQPATEQPSVLHLTHS